MSWWNIFPMHRVMSREYLQAARAVSKNDGVLQSSNLFPWCLFCIFKLCRFDVESAENGVSDRGKLAERSMEDLTRAPTSSHAHGMTRAARALTVR